MIFTFTSSFLFDCIFLFNPSTAIATALFMLTARPQLSPPGPSPTPASSPPPHCSLLFDRRVINVPPRPSLYSSARIDGLSSRGTPREPCVSHDLRTVQARFNALTGSVH
ncbi:hypothetical protein ASPBRDRAFT_41315 [Aspergillus brasiliensis CBS 101740]|uniref:Uncharacterized protein n=1 Tax=Aspergillus brasiliensis (strain CBS 101740 / IMI 381727 / IBT 21946) TaxID=767769 RepID=A0A1L9UPG7_ASPBC|nr:hypothetical protein ASPBRDRAFT_41315 [Aspergillus brasiliensis CBS 101740]